MQPGTLWETATIRCTIIQNSSLVQKWVEIMWQRQDMEEEESGFVSILKACGSHSCSVKLHDSYWKVSYYNATSGDLQGTFFGGGASSPLLLSLSPFLCQSTPSLFLPFISHPLSVFLIPFFPHSFYVTFSLSPPYPSLAILLPPFLPSPLVCQSPHSSTLALLR